NGSGHAERHSGEIAPALPIRVAKQQRNQRGTTRLDAQPELTRQFIAECGGAQLGNREPAGGHHERGSMELIGSGADDEMLGPRNLADFTSSDDADAGPAALFLEHG